MTNMTVWQYFGDTAITDKTFKPNQILFWEYIQGDIFKILPNIAGEAICEDS